MVHHLNAVLVLGGLVRASDLRSRGQDKGRESANEEVAIHTDLMQNEGVNVQVWVYCAVTGIHIHA